MGANVRLRHRACLMITGFRFYRALQEQSFLNPAIVTTILPGNAITAAGIGVGTAAHTRGARVLVRKTGTLKGLSVYVITTGGNIELGVLSTEQPRKVLYKQGATAVAANLSWQTPVDPLIQVKAGEELDFAFNFSETTPKIAGATGIAGALQLPSVYPLSAEGAKPFLTWDAAVTIPAVGSTISQAAMAGSAATPLIVAYVI